MQQVRRELLGWGITAAGRRLFGGLTEPGHTQSESRQTASGKCLRTIFNNDINSILFCSSGTDQLTSEEYGRAVDAILNLKPGVLAQNVGMPDPVVYPSEVATLWGKYNVQVAQFLSPVEGSQQSAAREVAAMESLLKAGTDPLKLTIKACRKQSVPVVASYRMNAEDYYQGTGLMSDFARNNPQWNIPGSHCLDPAIPEVYQHRMRIFREVLERYDIDGLEFDFRRWYHMVSDPLTNHSVLTRMVKDTRQLLDETAQRKGRKRLLLGARVGPSLASSPNMFRFPGMYYDQTPVNGSCKDLGLDVQTWIAQGWIDYLCPSLFGASGVLPGLPLTREFVRMARNTSTGIYPTLWPNAAWQQELCGDRTFRSISLGRKDQRLLALYKDELCTTALRMYEDGADGISSFNWYSYLKNAGMPFAMPDQASSDRSGEHAVQSYVFQFLGNAQAIREYREQPWAVPPKSEAK